MNPGSPPTSDRRSVRTGRHGGRGPSRAGRGSRRGTTTTISRQRFEGATDDLKGDIFDLVGARCADLFIKTKKAIANYVGRTYQHSGDIRRAIETLTIPTIPMPTAPVADPMPVLLAAIFSEQVKEYVKQTSRLQENIKRLWALVWGQCSDTIRTRLQALDAYDDMHTTSNGLQLLIAIKDLMFNVQEQKYVPLSIHLAKRQFFLLSQGRNTVGEYYDQFKNQTDVLSHIGAGIGHDTAIMRQVLCSQGINVDEATEAQEEAAETEGIQWYLALAFLMGSDRSRFGRLLEKLENDFTAGNDNYPKTLTDAYNMLLEWKDDPRLLMRMAGNDGVSFVTNTIDQGDDTELRNNNKPRDNDTTHANMTFGNGGRGRGSGRNSGRGGGGSNRNNVQCFRCGAIGHYASECPENLEDAQRMLAETAETGTNMLHHTTLHDPTTEQTNEMNFATLNVDEIDTEDNDTSFVFTQDMRNIEAQHGGHLPPEWILLDNQSTVDVFANRRLLKNIRRAKTNMFIHCTAGVAKTNLIRDLPGYGTVWYHPNGIANILSLSKVKEKHRVTFDSNQGNQFIVHRKDGTQRIFQQSPRGLYFLDTSLSPLPVNKANGTVLVTTVADKANSFSNADYAQAVLARKIQKIIGRPTTRAFIYFIENNLLPNCPVNRRDVLRAEQIFGPDVGALKGKTVRRQPPRVQVDEVTLPPTIQQHYQDVTLACDIMYVNKVPFLMSISRHIRFGTAQHIKNQQGVTIFNGIRAVHQIYLQRGFRIRNAFMDGQFEPLRGNLAELGILLNTASNDEHVPEIERQIRTVKERTWAIYCTLPFNKMPRHLIIEMVYAANYWLNMFPRKGGVSKTLSPRALLTGKTWSYTTHCKLEFGDYVQTHEEHENSMVAWTIGAIALRPTGNAQGSYFFFSLTTGRVLNRGRWTSLPMPNEVIDRVHRMARQEHGQNGLLFEDRNHNSLVDPDDDGEDDSTYHPEHDNNDDDNDDGDDGEDDDDPDPAQPPNPHDEQPIHNNPPDMVTIEDPDQNEQVDYNDAGNDEETITNQNEEQPTNNMDEPLPTNPQDNEGPINNDIGTQVLPNDPTLPPRAQRELNRLANDGVGPTIYQGRTRSETHQQAHNMITNTQPEPTTPLPYQHMTSFEKELFRRRIAGVRVPSEIGDEQNETLRHTVLTQYTLKKGLQVFGPPGVEAVYKELQQLHERKVGEPRHATTLSPMQKKNALGYLMFLKQKRTGQIKGRGCADGRKQRLDTPKGAASSPTVATESVLLSCVIDAKEQRDVATVDIPGAFMQGDQDETIHMRLEGTLAELLTKCEPKLYRQYVVTENGKPVLYVELVKALYGTLRAALIFWRKLTSKLVEWGFTINPYDWCVANKQINGQQCTLVWHVDNMKISHADRKVVTNIIQQLEQEFGKEAPLTIHRGKIHDYLGMMLDFSRPGKVQITMKECIRNMLADLPEDMEGEAATPAAEHLFKTNDTPTHLNDEKAMFFHHNVAKLLFLCKRARPDLQTTVAFLSTRVQKPDVDDYKKLARAMKYLRKTITLPLTLEADDLQLLYWWIDGAFAIHRDMRSHTGGAMSLGKGIIYGTSTRQKLNTRSSTEAELVAVDDCMSQVLWTRYFLSAQGYNINDCVIYQDNKSAILLEENGRASSSKRTRHINIRYYFVTDRANCGEIKVQHCPTTEMLGDYFTKPLQGGLFTKFRDRILNLQDDPSTVPVEDHRSVLGHDQSHATNQSQGQSHTSPFYDQANGPKLQDQATGIMSAPSVDKPNVPSVMTPMTQPLGGWHVTSMTGQPKPAMSIHDQPNQQIG